MDAKQKILIADDERDFVEILRQRLEASGYLVVYAFEGIRTVELAHREHPDLIILDWLMPAGKGNTVLEFLKAKDDTRNIPVIVITGVEDDSVETKARSLGAVDYIRKPYDSKLLLQKIQDILTKCRVDNLAGK